MRYAGCMSKNTTLNNATMRMRVRAQTLDLTLHQYRDHCTMLMHDLMIWHEAWRDGSLEREHPEIYKQFFPEGLPANEAKAVKPLPHIYYFGWSAPGGHFLLKDDHNKILNVDSTPFGRSIDGGLCPQPEPKQPDGKVALHYRAGWTAVAFWDRSGDHRPGSNTVFLTPADCSAMGVIAAAKVQWPQVFARPGFPLNRAEDTTKPTV